MDNFAEMGPRIGVPVIARSQPWRITPAKYRSIRAKAKEMAMTRCIRIVRCVRLQSARCQTAIVVSLRSNNLEI
jgi:hypothetical protein